MKSTAWLCCLLLVGCGSPKETPISTTSSTQTTDPTCAAMAKFVHVPPGAYDLEFDIDATDDKADWGVVCHGDQLLKKPTGPGFTIDLGPHVTLPSVYVRLPASLKIKWKGTHQNETIEDSIDASHDATVPTRPDYLDCFQYSKSGHISSFDDGKGKAPTHTYMKFDLCTNSNPKDDDTYSFVIHLDKEGQTHPINLDPQIINHGTGLHGK